MENVDVRKAREEGFTVLGVLIGIEEYVVDRKVGVVKDGGADRLARCMLDRQATSLIAVESLGRMTSCLASLNMRGIRVCPSKHARGQTTGRRRYPKKSTLPGILYTGSVGGTTILRLSEAAALTTTEQLPLPPRHASANYARPRQQVSFD